LRGLSEAQEKQARVHATAGTDDERNTTGVSAPHPDIVFIP
jgi:hypothetical protein